VLEREHLDASRVAEIIRAQFPDVAPAVVRYLGEGYDSTAFDVDDKWVFRFPKRRDVEDQLLLESRLLPILAEQSPIPLPSFTFLGRPSASFPRHFGGYPKLLGEPAIGLELQLTPLPAWASLLARFLSWLHAVPTDKATDLGAPTFDLASLLDEVRSEALSDFARVREVSPNAPVHAWHAFIDDGPPTSSPSSLMPVLVHGDLAAEHVLYDARGQTITGVIDWSEVGVGDPAIDFAGLFHWGGASFVHAVLANYHAAIDEAALARARYLAACRGVGDVVFGLETGRTEYLKSGIRALHMCVEF
jgi:aminoglycoside phosphotransferase (APT) family kinase protein